MSRLSVFIAFLFAFPATKAYGPFSDDFLKFLQENPKQNEFIIAAYQTYGDTGTFGGMKKDEKITRTPVIFIHGNSDSALYHNEYTTGWSEHVKYFMEHGYNSAELYGVSYGDRNLTNSLHNRISCANMLGIRRFIEAVIAYTKTEKVSVVAHSMGVSLARKAIQGGKVVMETEMCELGEPLRTKIDSLIAIASANYGMCLCLVDGLSSANACSAQDGFYPGLCGKDQANSQMCGSDVTSCEKLEYAQILQSLNAIETTALKDAEFVASLWSKDDPVLGKDNWVWGQKTSLVPLSDFTYEYEHLDHAQTKDKTIPDQFSLVTRRVRSKDLHGKEHRHRRHL